jgi:cell division protein FtsZ
MNTESNEPPNSPDANHLPMVKIFGVGNAGVELLELFDKTEFAGADFVAINTDAGSLARSTATVKIHLETKLMRGLGTGGDPERGRALAEEHFNTLKSACAGANVVLLVTGLGGGAGSGMAPVLAQAVKDSGALTLAFVTLPFTCEGNRRRQQAHQSLEHLKLTADGVICLPNQKAFKLIDENTSVLETFRITGSLLAESVRGVWRLLTRPGLIQIHFDDLCSLLRDRHSESAFAFVEAAGPARSRETVEKLLAHPLLDEGRALADADALLISIMGGKDLTMAEINRVMEQINRHCERAQVIMGAAIDPEMKNRLSVTLIAAKNLGNRSTSSASGESCEGPVNRVASSRPTHRATVPPSNSTMPEQRDILSGRHGSGTRGKRPGPKMLQTQLPLAIVSKGRFDKSEPTIYKGEDLDIPTYIRRGVPLN